MKRLLLSLTAALALGAYAETGDYGGTGFESLTPGNALDITKDDAGDTTARFWEGKDGEEYGVISNHIGAVEVAGLNGKNNYLKVEADSTLYRYALDNQQEDRTIDVSGKAGIYFDSLVQFTGAEEIPVNDGADRAKLAVWLYKSDAEDGAFGIGTNLVVTAGYLDAGNNVTATNYVTTLSPDEGWHRLTVKMIPEIGTASGVAGFVVFIDGVAVANADAKGDTGSVMDSLNATAGKWNDDDALFPSMIRWGAKDAQTFECVGFKGQGALDELLVTENAPAFAADGTLFTLNWDAGLASLTIDEAPVAGFVEGEAGSTVIQVATAGSTYTVVAEALEGYNLGTRTVSGGVESAGNDFTVNGTGVGNIVVNQAKFIVNGQPYSTLADAIAAAGEGGTVKLGADIDEAISLDEASIVLDLAGHDITTSKEEMADPAIMVSSSATLVLIDSIGGGTISGGDINNAGCVYSEGLLTIGQAEDDEGVTIDGYACGELLIVKGKFLCDDNSEDELAEALDDDSSIDVVGEYFVVTPGGAVEKYAITWDALDNATVSAADTNGKPVESGDKFIEGTEIVFTVDPDADYTYADVEIGTWTLLEDGTISNLVVIGTEDIKVTIPEPKEAPAPTMWAVTFSTNNVEVTEAETEVEDGGTLALKQIPEFEGGTWDVDPATAVITCATNFNYTIQEPEPTVYTITYVDAVVTNGVTEFTAETETFSLPTAADVEARSGGEFKGWTNELGVAVTQVEKGTDHDLTFYAVWEAAGVFYPTYIDLSNDEIKAKFNDWATNVAKDRDTESANLDAFLLNCTPAQVETAKAAFKITSIEKVGDEWVVKACDKVDGEEYLNGYVNIVPYDINGEAADPANAEFFQATLTVEPVNK